VFYQLSAMSKIHSCEVTTPNPCNSEIINQKHNKYSLDTDTCWYNTGSHTSTCVILQKFPGYLFTKIYTFSRILSVYYRNILILMEQIQNAILIREYKTISMQRSRNL